MGFLPMSRKIAFKSSHRRGKRPHAWPTRLGICGLFSLEGLGFCLQRWGSTQSLTQTKQTEGLLGPKAGGSFGAIQYLKPTSAWVDS